MAQDTSESPVEACFDYVNVLVKIHLHQEVLMHKNRFPTLHYANNDRHKGALSSVRAHSFV
ncbi:hypothetical protein T03_14050 [Trichinella britovi]|uniref:Uncharacterized protein n=1 Tax=Trichinella britovi TaxID=45882 RepID=A0A0V1CY47_TRIBR|nr:hypothetical protein T03_14050 [Trichinella britovi]